MLERGSGLGSALGIGSAAGGSAADLVVAALIGLSGLLACGSDAGGEAGAAPAAPGEAEPSEVEPTEGAPALSGRYQFVETPEGMAVETFRAGSVQTVSCPVRSCAGLCDECAAAACRAAGELEAACNALVSSCAETCNCGSGGLGCGFPVCAFDRQICYLEGEGLSAAVPGGRPGDPGPDPAPLDPASSPSGSGASQPAPVP
jgi:hypothetical protein